MNNEKLIEKYEKMKANKKRLTSVDLVLKDLRSLDEPEPLPFKLKDVVGRIRGFDPTTQAIWLNTILKELGNDYGLMKYRSGYDQGLLDGAGVGNQLKDADKVRRELNKPVVKQFIADWYEENKDVFEANLYRFVCNLTSIFDGAKINEFERWFLTAGTKPFQTLINMHQFGYEVEKEKQYLVKVKGICGNHETLNREKHSNKWLFSDREENSLYGTHHTRNQLEEAGFGWVFDCEGIKIKEVE